MDASVPASDGSDCPARDTLIDFDLGRLPAERLSAVALHVAACPRCEEVLHRLQNETADDRVIAHLRRSMKGPPLPAGPACDAIRENAETFRDTPGSRRRPPSSSGFGFDLDLPEDSTVGSYELFGKIGEGGMGVVYLARQVPLRRMVALKMVRAGHRAGDKAVARFAREGKAVARLQHPNVVQVYELGEHDGLPYFSMELVSGGNLNTRLERGPMEPRAAAEVVRTLALAVSYAHNEGVIHRDLKPANILMTWDGTPKIADFGVAKLLDTDLDDPTADRTEPGTAVGTPSYMSPEQAAGSPEVGKASDCYSLGAILYEALTGRPPFSAETKRQTLELVRTATPEAPSTVRPDVPRWLEAICLKCLEKSPARRYPSAQALADDLGLWLDDQRPRGIPGPLERAGRRLRRYGVAAAVLLGVVSAGAAAYVHDPGRAPRVAQADLARGRAVTLIGQTGGPKWSRWRSGQAESQEAANGKGGTFRAQSWTTGLLELLPDPGCDRYRFAAEVRHEKSDSVSCPVGIYVSYSDREEGGARFQFVTRLTFNDVRSDPDLRAENPPGTLPARTRPLPNVVSLHSELLSDGPAWRRGDWWFSQVSGPRFKPPGEARTGWRRLELVVTPELVTARWEGQPFSVATAAVDGAVRDDLSRYPNLSTRLPRGYTPAFRTRGGLGLYVTRGAASFRSVTVTPL